VSLRGTILVVLAAGAVLSGVAARAVLLNGDGDEPPPAVAGDREGLPSTTEAQRMLEQVAAQGTSPGRVSAGAVRCRLRTGRRVQCPPVGACRRDGVGRRGWLLDRAWPLAGLVRAPSSSDRSRVGGGRPHGSMRSGVAGRGASLAGSPPSAFANDLLSSLTSTSGSPPRSTRRRERAHRTCGCHRIGGRVAGTRSRGSRSSPAGICLSPMPSIGRSSDCLSCARRPMTEATHRCHHRWMARMSS
jgi:hypothetical protein